MLDDTVSRGGYDDIPVLLERLNAYTAKWGTPTKELNILRSEIQKQCIAAKDSDENLLSLTVPTGGGKTISSLAFALNYAVQFFESLFSNKPSKSRKLHNISDSVIIFDEAQMLPIQYLVPCVKVIKVWIEISVLPLMHARHTVTFRGEGDCVELRRMKS